MGRHPAGTEGVIVEEYAVTLVVLASGAWQGPAMLFDVIIFRRGSGYIGHCLQTGIIVERPTAREVRAVLCTEIQQSIVAGNMGQAAPFEIWDMAATATRVEQRIIPLQAPAGYAALEVRATEVL